MTDDTELALFDSVFDRLFPLLRSITGPGIETSLAIIAEHMPLEIFGVASGTSVFDWIVPPQWSCRAATLTDPHGNIVCDLSASNLHVVNYSAAIDQYIPLAQLQKHLHSIPGCPDAVPYVTSYYRRNWGFCISQKIRDALPDGLYHARIDAEFSNGRVPLAHCLLHGNQDREILLSSYLCHPSLANNELSGPLVLLGLYRRISRWPQREHSFRFVLNPETIGSLCYLYLHGEHLARKLAGGLVLTCLGGPAELSYKSSRRGNTAIDRLATHWHRRQERLRLRPFTAASGSDERQYCSPGFNLPIGQMARSVYGEFPGYHNSLDTKASMGIPSLLDSINRIESFLLELDASEPRLNLCPFGEPHLSKHNLYPSVNSAASRAASSDEIFDGGIMLHRILNILNYSDGDHDLIHIAELCGYSVRDLLPIVARLEVAGLLERARFRQ